MPLNPFVRTGRLQGESPQPQWERIPEDNQPYRGSENHGVQPNEKPMGRPDDAIPQGRPVEYDTPPESQQVVPVRIVQDDSHELRRVRLSTMLAAPLTEPASQILGKDSDRTRVRLKHNTTDVTVWLSHERHLAKVDQGWPLSAGEVWETVSQEAVYAATDDTDGTPVYLTIEFSSTVDG